MLAAHRVSLISHEFMSTCLIVQSQATAEFGEVRDDYCTFLRIDKDKGKDKLLVYDMLEKKRAFKCTTRH